jgi:mono/diheme cytochrome c family protein
MMTSGIRAGALAAMLFAAGMLWWAPSAGHAQGAKTAAKVDAAELYKTKCIVCHGPEGNATTMPNMSFADGVWKHGATVKEVSATITKGVPGTAMMPFAGQLSDAEIAALARYVRRFDKKLK